MFNLFFVYTLDDCGCTFAPTIKRVKETTFKGYFFETICTAYVEIRLSFNQLTPIMVRTENQNAQDSRITNYFHCLLQPIVIEKEEAKLIVARANVKSKEFQRLLAKLEIDKYEGNETRRIPMGPVKSSTELLNCTAKLYMQFWEIIFNCMIQCTFTTFL